MLQKDLQLRQDLEKQYTNKNVDLGFRIEQLQETILNLEKEIQRRDTIIKEKQEENDLVYKKMKEISSKVEKIKFTKGNLSLHNNEEI